MNNQTNFVTHGFRRFITRHLCAPDHSNYVLSLTKDMAVDVLKECVRQLDGKPLAYHENTYHPVYGGDNSISVQYNPDTGDILVANNEDSIRTMYRLVNPTDF
jgi:hypothetical protein